MVENNVRQGERIHLKWTLPFDTEPADHVVLPTAGDDLTFYDLDGELLTTFNRVADHEEYWLGYENGSWIITFDTNDTSFLFEGVSTYEFTLLDETGEPVMVVNGEVVIND